MSLLPMALPILQSSFLPPTSIPFPTPPKSAKHIKPLSISSTSCNTKPKLVRCPSLDRHASDHNRLRFVRKLTTLLLSKPQRFLPLRILSRCRRYLSLPHPRPLLPIILRYPLLFSLSHLPSPHSPHSSLLSVSLTPQFAAIAADSSSLSASLLSSKLHRLLLLSSHRRLLLSKLVHIAPDLGLPPNFRSRLCNSHPHLFRTVPTSFGRALQLTHLPPSLPRPSPPIPHTPTDKPIIDRPPKFKHLKLRRGLNLKRRHRDFLIAFHESPPANPYDPCEGSTDLEKERRACAAVREVLMMTTAKRTLVDHLTHFRKEFGLPNRLRAMLVRHPEMFYVSVKGERDSVFLVEAFDDEGRLVVEDEMGSVKQRLMELVREGKRLRRERKRGIGIVDDKGEEEEEKDQYGEDDDGFEDLFNVGIGDDWEVFDGEEEDTDDERKEIMEFWSTKFAEEGDGRLDVW